MWPVSYRIRIGTNHHLFDQHPHAQLNDQGDQALRRHTYTDGDSIADSHPGCHQKQRCYPYPDIDPDSHAGRVSHTHTDAHADTVSTWAAQ